MRVEKREFAREFSQLSCAPVKRGESGPLRMLASHSNRACNFSYRNAVGVLQLSSTLMTGPTLINSHQNLNQFKVLMRVGGQTLARVATLTNSHQLSSSFDRPLNL